VEAGTKSLVAGTESVVAVAMELEAVGTEQVFALVAASMAQVAEAVRMAGLVGMIANTNWVD